LSFPFPRPLPARPAGEGVQRLEGPGGRGPVAPRPSHGTASPAGQAGRGRSRLSRGRVLALELFHLPGKPAGVKREALAPHWRSNAARPQAATPTRRLLMSRLILWSAAALLLIPFAL